MPFFDPEVMGAAVDEAASKVDALLFGRRTWEVMAAAWPERAGDPFADFMNSVPKYVVSDSLDDSDVSWAPTTIIRGSALREGVDEIRGRSGRDVSVMGSATLVRSLLAEDLVDELLLMIEPIVLGGGKGIFPSDGVARTFELVSATTATTGVQICRYVRAR
jgi:dihydrofolate reductase